MGVAAPGARHRGRRGPTAPAGAPPEADAAVTATRGLPLAVLTADCAPIALARDDAVGVVHAGWRGLLAGVVEAGVDAVRRRDPGAVGPRRSRSVHRAPRSTSSAPPISTGVVERLGPAVAARTADGRPALDIPAAVRAALARAGVTDCDDGGVCTAESADHFSYRRDATTGRQALVVVLEP